MRIFFVFLLLMTVSFASTAAEPAAGSQMGDCLLPKPRVTFNLPPLLVYESDNPVTGKQDHLRILGPLFESYRKANGSLVIHSDNPKYTDETITKDDQTLIHIFGRVIYREGSGGL